MRRLNHPQYLGILRHSNLSTTQLYLGKISDTEALRWIENIYG